MKDFLQAALPWIVMGILLAVSAVRMAVRDKSAKPNTTYAAVGMCLGAAVGVATSNLFSPGLSLAVFMALGFVLGSFIPKRGKDDESDKKM